MPEQETNVLRLSEIAVVRAASRQWFWVRSGFIICYMLATLIAVHFFPEGVLSKFHLLYDMSPDDAQDYLCSRMVVMRCAMAIYFISYWRSWHFPLVALAAIPISIASLISDVFVLYIYVKAEALIAVEIIFGLRVLIILFFTMNYFSAIAETHRR